MRAVVYVPHKGETKMVGKLFVPPGGVGLENSGLQHVFLHETQSKQWHYGTNSPGGIDTCVLAWLRSIDEELQVPSVVDIWVRDKKKLYRAFAEQLRIYGVDQQSDGRNRTYMAAEHWGKLDRLPYTPPWITTRKVIDPTWEQQEASYSHEQARQSPPASPEPQARTLELPLKLCSSSPED